MKELTEINTKLKEIKDDVVACQKCELCKTRTLPVVGQGNHRTRIVLVGEAPGANEDRTGVPFCGAAGRILDELLASAGVKREDVYICNILKCRPPQNREPLPDEKTACVPYLERQLEAIEPTVLGAMGNHAVSFLFAKYNLAEQKQGISKLHGRIFETGIDFPSKIVALYHPAVAVYNGQMKDALKNDFKILAEIIR